MKIIVLLSKFLCLMSLCLAITACKSTSPSQSVAIPENLKMEDMQIVDCLLPGQVRKLGNSTYMTPRRPTRTTQSDCSIRGGEFVAFDRADYKTALKVWMQAAEAGDAEAQTNVGEIFERGYKGEPNYTAAALWYSKAAEAGNARAQFNLATLYEQGKGVEQDKMVALNWYRKAWGVPQDDIIFQSAVQKQMQEERAILEKQLSQQNKQIKLLNNQLNQLKQQKTSTSTDAKNKELQQELAELQQWIASIEKQRIKTQSDFDELPVFRQPSIQQPLQPQDIKTAINVKGLNFGNYYALVIGNQDYVQIDKLNSPINDARSIASLLESKYGFAVTTLINANNIEVMQAINNLNNYLTEKDNLLIFYAGHGSRLQAGDIEDGYWLPVNADPPPTNTYWVSNEFITKHLARLKVKRVMVVADSCYAGLLSSAKNYLFTNDQFQYSEKYLSYKLAKKTRMVLSSGGDQPVLDNAGQGHSVFAKAFLDELNNNDKIMAGPELFQKIKTKVIAKAKQVGVEQTPKLSVIKGANHEAGDFFFVPASMTK